jgi:hypothetical protein
MTDDLTGPFSILGTEEDQNRIEPLLRSGQCD